MRTVTATEYSKKVGLYQAIAQREPIVVTSHGREGTVLISADEYRAEREEGTKDRPYAVIIATRTKDCDIVIMVAPVTHSLPARMQDGIELTAEVKRILGLDAERSWLICSELNRFVSPGPDLRPIPRPAPGNFVYGMLPSPFMGQVPQRLALLRAERRPHMVFRSL